MSIEEFEIMRVSNQSLNGSSCIDTRQNEVCVLEVEVQNVILCRRVKYVKHENGHNITCMEFEKYMISKEDLEQTSCERRLLKDWDKKGQGHASPKESVQVSFVVEQLWGNIEDSLPLRRATDS
jgi:hypothetical protein